ncbi:MAG: mersacidin/lichenicidin family type 2 lantibiotic [Acidobacteriota bacterium]
MKKQDVIRAWRDPKYRRSLETEQSNQLPEHPAGKIKAIDDDVLASVTGGCCPPFLISTSPEYCTALCSPCPPRFCF